MTLTQTEKMLAFVITGFLILILIVFFWIQLSKKPKQTTFILPNTDPNQHLQNEEIVKMKSQLDSLSQPKSSPSPTYQSNQGNDNFPLRLGSVGKRVEQLQLFLKARWNFQGVIDGKFGRQTLAGLGVIGSTELSESMYDTYNLGIIPTQIFQ
jgi:hypothetical protein